MNNNTIIGGLCRAVATVLLVAGAVFGLNWAFDWLDQANSLHNIIGLVGILLILTTGFLILKRIFKHTK